MHPAVIGVAGGSGSGKTTVARAICESAGADAVMVGQDSYYFDHSELTIEDRAKINYDHPAAFDNELLAEHLKALRSGREIRRPIYNYATHSRMEETVTVKPAPVIIVEGILVLLDPMLRELMDIKVFVDTDADVRFIRRLRRDVSERGRSLQSVIDQYLNVVRLMHLEFVEPSKRFADIIIPEGGHNVIAVDMLTTRISAMARAAAR